MPPVDGVTTAQVNIREKPSTASASAGLLGIFSPIQITGRDASGSWLQIVYSESTTGKGWVRAEFVQVAAGVEIQPLAAESGSGAVTQKVNVRSGPGAEFDLLGVLNSNDQVFITDKNEGGQWLQIEFAAAPDGRGWVAAEFVQGDMPQPTPTVGASPPALAATDGDSQQDPLAAVVFSVTGSRIFQVADEVDAEDWIRFTTWGGVIAVQLDCDDDSLLAELWQGGAPVKKFSCGDAFTTNLDAGDYFLKLASNVRAAYVLRVEVIR